MKLIGQWLKKQRLEAGKSQLDAAMDSFVSVDTIRKIENGSIYPRTNHFEKLCRLFRVSPLEYYLDAEAPEADSEPTSPFGDKDCCTSSLSSATSHHSMPLEEPEKDKVLTP